MGHASKAGRRGGLIGKEKITEAVAASTNQSL